MNSRLQSLIDNGYDEKEVLELSSYTDEDLDKLSDIALEISSKNAKSSDNPSIIYIGGQPGSGKTVFLMDFKKDNPNYIDICIDNYRTYHPNYLKIEDCIRKHWKNKKETMNSSPGNDMANFTHLFSGEMTNIMLRKAKEKKFNVAVEWSMREPIEPLESMKEFKNNNYNVNVIFIATNKNVSIEGYSVRNDVMSNHEIIVRKMPLSFHNLCIETLPDAVDYINENGCKAGIVDNMYIIDREGYIIWQKNDETKPGKLYKEYFEKGNIYSNEEKYAEVTYNKEIEGLKFIEI